MQTVSVNIDTVVFYFVVLMGRGGDKGSSLLRGCKSPFLIPCLAIMMHYKLPTVLKDAECC